MKITQVETLQADAGWRMFSFLKITTSDGIIGWSEFNESFGSTGLSDVIKGIAPVLIGSILVFATGMWTAASARRPRPARHPAPRLRRHDNPH